MSRVVLIPLPRTDFDPTEVAVPWKVLSNAGIRVVFSTPEAMPAKADPIMTTGRGLGLLKSSMRADANGRAAYSELVQSQAFNHPIQHGAIRIGDFDGILLPGGHARGMKEYLESSILQSAVGQAFDAKKPVGAICHGVVLAARSKQVGTQRSVLYGHRTTALPRWMELLAWNLTKLWLGSYYRTYPETVQDEVTAALKQGSDFAVGPLGLTRDSEKHMNRGFTVRSGHYLSARWPGDAHTFGHAFANLVQGLPLD